MLFQQLTINSQMLESVLTESTHDNNMKTLTESKIKPPKRGLWWIHFMSLQVDSHRNELKLNFILCHIRTGFGLICARTFHHIAVSHDPLWLDRNWTELRGGLWSSLNVTSSIKFQICMNIRWYCKCIKL